MLPFLGSTAFAATATAVSGATISQPPSPATAGLTAAYGVQFTTSSSGALTAGSGTITIAWPSGSTVPSTASDYTVQVSTGNSVAASTVAVNSAGDAVTITTPTAVAASTQVTVVASGVKNPLAGTYTLVISTSADTAEVATSNTFTIGGSPTEVTSVTGPNPVPNTISSSSLYTIGFKTSSTGALAANSGTITLAGPTGTDFPLTATAYTVNNVAVATLYTVSSSGTCNTNSTYSSTAASVCIVTPVAVADSSSVTVVVDEVTNPSAASGSDTIAVSTSSDSSPVSTLPYSIISPPGIVTVNHVYAASPSTASPSSSTIAEAGQGASYDVNFTTTSSPSGSLVADIGQIILTAPTGTSWPSSNTAYTVTDSTSTVSGTAYAVSVNSTTVTITTPVAVAAGDTVNVAIVGVTDPSSSSAGSATLPSCTLDSSGECFMYVSTTSDAGTAMGGYTIGTGVTNVSVSINDNAAGVGGTKPPNSTYQPVYTVSFTTTSTLPSSSSLVLTAPTGTVWPGSSSDYTVNSIAVSAAPSLISSEEVSITTPTAIPASSSVTVVVDGVTNPSTSSTSDTIEVSTSADIFPAASTPYTIAPTSVYDINGPAISNLDATASATYTLTPTVQTALSSGDTITVVAPAGTTFPASGYTINGSSASAVVSSGGSTTTITTPTGVSVSAGGSVVIEISGVINPAEGRYVLSVSTETDPTSASSPPYKILSSSGTGTPSGTVSNVAIPTLSNDWTYSSTYDNLAVYSTSFSTSSVGALTADAGTITVTAPSGTTFSSTTSYYVVNGIVAASAVPSVGSGSTTDNQVVITTGVDIPPSSTVDLVIQGVENPKESTSNTISIATSSDTGTGTSGDYTTVSSPTEVFYYAGCTNAAGTLVDINTVPDAAGQTSTYCVSFETSLSGALAAGSGTITLQAPAGTTFSSTASDYVVNGTAAASVVPSVASGSGSTTDNQVVITVNAAIAVSTSVMISLNGAVTNPPPNLPASPYTITISTSSDQYAGSPTSGCTSPSNGTACDVTSSYFIYNGVSNISGPVPDPAIGQMGTTSPTDYYCPPNPGAPCAIYTIGFTVPDATSSGSYIYLGFPTGTVLPNSSTNYVVNGVVSGGYVSCPTPLPQGFNSGDICAEIATPADIAAGSAVTVTVAGVGNPPAGSKYAVQIATSVDAAAVSTSTYTLNPAVSVTAAPTLSGTNSNIAGANGVTYTQSFTTSSVGALTGGQGTITFTAPTGTVFSSVSTDYTISVNGGSSVNPSKVSGGGTDSVTLTTPVAIPASTSVTVVAGGVTNPTTPGTYSLDVSTSSDTQAVSAVTAAGIAGTYTIGGAVSNLTGPAPSPGTPQATDSTYTLGFDTSATGALTAQSDTITVTAPSGTIFPSSASDYTVNGVEVTTLVSGGSDTAKIETPVTIGDSSSVSLVISGVTNPTEGQYTLSVNTSQDKSPTTSLTYGIGTSVTNVTGPSPSTTIAGATANYTVGFTTSSSGALTGGSGEITLIAPSGTTFPALSGSNYTVNGTAASTASVDANGNEVVIVVPSSIPASTAVTVAITGVTNPPGGSYTLGVYTSSDFVEEFTPSYTIIAVPTVTSISPTSGPTTGGTPVTITGTGFVSGATVMFGTVTATAVTVSSATSITATSPAESAGTVNVTVTTAGGTSATSSADQFTYKVTVPTVTSISPTSGPTTGGTSVTITGTNFVSGATVMFGTVTATAVTVSSATSITATSPAESAGTVNVTVTTAGGTSATSSADQFTYVVPITGDAYTPVNPARLADTRCSASSAPSYCSGENLPSANASLGILAARKSENVTVTGVDGIPLTATAVVVNVTAVNMTGGGYLSIYPEGSTPAVVSSLNWTPKSGVVTNLVTVPVNATNGEITVFNGGTSGYVNYIVDIEGYYAAPGSTPAGLYNSVTPSRLVDTRCSESPLPVGIISSYCASLPSANSKLTTLGADQTENVTVTGVGSVPSSGVSAVVLNLTAIGPTSGGYLTAFPAGATKAVVSTVNFNNGKTVPNRVIVKVGTNGQISIYNYSGNVNFAVDVSGYYTDGSSSSQTGSLFNPVTPARILDTRCSESPLPTGITSSYCSAIPSANATLPAIAGGKSITVQVTGEANIPTDATAVVGNLTATGSTGGGYLTVYAGSTAPTTSDVNFAPGTTDANMVISELNSSGQVNIANGGGQSVNALLDVSGWFTAATS